MELEVLELSQRLHESLVQPSPCKCLGGRSPLAPLHVNTQVNPFGFTHQRNKAARKAVAAVAQQTEVALDRQQSLPGDADAAQQSGVSDEEMAAPRSVQGGGRSCTPLPSVAQGPASRPSPTPFALFRGRLSFGIEGSSARKFDASSTPKVQTLAIKRKLTDSPSGDLLLVFPSVKRMAACRRRCPSLCDLAPMSDDNQAGPSSVSGLAPSLDYWSDPLPLPPGVDIAAVGQERPGAEGGEDSPSLRDDAASPLPVLLLAAAEGIAGGAEGAEPDLASNGAMCSPFLSSALPPGWASAWVAREAGPSSASTSRSDCMDTDSPGCCPALPASQGTRSGWAPALSPAGMANESLMGLSGSGHSSGGCSGSWGFAQVAAAASPPPSRQASGCAAALPPPFSPLASGPVSCVPLVDHPDCGLPSITPQTAAELVASGGASHGFQRCIVVDCRYGYEFQGGCIRGAVNINTPDGMDRLLEATADDDWQGTALVLHCEFSSERGPRMFRHVREADRRAHLADYPVLSYPHMFILQGGYKAFVRASPQLCTPAGSYTPMDHPDFIQELKDWHKAVKAAWVKTRRSYEMAQQRRGRRYVLRPASAQDGGGSSGPPALGAARHLRQAPSL